MSSFVNDDNDPYISILREYIDFINLQVGSYVEGCSAFERNKIMCERQVMRISRSHGMKIDEAGNKIVMRSSLEDPTQPDVIHQRIVRSRDFIADNSPQGTHEQQLSRAIIVFLYTYWENEIRPRLEKAKGAAVNSDIMGELRLVRIAILHTKGILSEIEYRKLKLLSAHFEGGRVLVFNSIVMNRVFVLIKQGMAQLIFERLGVADGPVKADQLKDIAIQGFR